MSLSSHTNLAKNTEAHEVWHDKKQRFHLCPVVQLLNPNIIIRGLCQSILIHFMQSSDYQPGYKLLFSPSHHKLLSRGKGDLGYPQLYTSLRQKIAHLTLPVGNLFQLLDDEQSRQYLFGHFWVQHLIEFWYESASPFCAWLCMQSIFDGGCLCSCDCCLFTIWKLYVSTVRPVCHIFPSMIHTSLSYCF